MENTNSKKEKKKGFFAKLFEKIDKKLEDKAKKSGCCCAPSKDKKDSDGDSCCG
ncbi:MAG: hypothetical protein V1882_04295 [Candidatus Omnitrophota bacterium]